MATNFACAWDFSEARLVHVLAFSRQRLTLTLGSPYARGSNASGFAVGTFSAPPVSSTPAVLSASTDVMSTTDSACTRPCHIHARPFDFLASVFATAHASPKQSRSPGLPRKTGESPNADVSFTIKFRNPRPFLGFAPTTLKRLGQNTSFSPISLHLHVKHAIFHLIVVPYTLQVPRPRVHCCTSHLWISTSHGSTKVVSLPGHGVPAPYCLFDPLTWLSLSCYRSTSHVWSRHPPSAYNTHLHIYISLPDAAAALQLDHCVIVEVIELQLVCLSRCLLCTQTSCDLV